jgi:CheY-like chemotaxis protein
MAWNEIRHRARLVRDYGEDVPRIFGNEGRLGQVVLNLLVNAAQALPEGAAEANQITLRTFRKGDRVVVAVRDSGAGIAPEHRARLFEPFFTTKPVGVGTGLGLYICRQIVESMGGTISVESIPGGGATFAVALPIAACGAQAPVVVDTPVPAVRRARILSVDDEPRIGSVLKQALAPHEVVDLTSAEQALERIRKGERFDLIFCDLMMPRVTGMDFHAALTVEAPEQARRTVFLTGGAFTARAHAFLDQVENPRVEKPFNLAGLRALVAERLQMLRGDLN